MRRSYQMSLFGGGPGKGFLFDKRLLEQYLNDHASTHIPNEDRLARTIQQWVQSIRSTAATETSLEPRFINDILCGVLGYKSFPPTEGETATVYHKPSQRLTEIERVPDAMFGEFTASSAQFTAAVELKSPGTNLDAPQTRHGSETPVEQGFFYGSRILGVRWVIVSDMRLVRLYSVESAGEYEEFDLRDAVDLNGDPSPAFRRLWFLLHCDYLLSGYEESQVHVLFDKSAGRQFAIRDSFYQVYYQIRLVSCS